MATVQTAHFNLLESSTVTLTAGAALAGYPLYRVHDRDIGAMFIGSAAVTTTIHIDAGAAFALYVDRLLIPAGHNLAGVALSLEHSPDDASWTPALTGWTGAAGDINKTWTSILRRYWRFTATSPAAAPSLAELWLTLAAAWERNPDHPGGDDEPIHNVTVTVTAEGRPRFEVNGASLRQRNYTISGMSDTQRTQFQALWVSFAGCKPFWLCDTDGTWIYGRLLGGLRLHTTYDAAGVGVHEATFNFLECPA